MAPACYPLALSTVEEVYFISDINDIFLSVSACKCLNLIHPNFPCVIGSASAREEQEELDASSDAEGGQPAGTRVQNKENMLPIRPDSMPFAPSEENIQKLEEWLLKAFADSTFDVNAYPLPVRMMLRKYYKRCQIRYIGEGPSW